MADIRKIEDLRIWQSARVICKDVYVLTRKEEFEKDFRFVQQIRSASGSIMDNIAEGFGRGGNKEFLQFLTIARGSIQEVLSQLYRAFDVGYITEDELEVVKQNVNSTAIMIHNLIEAIKKSDMKGSKYNTEPHWTTLNYIEQLWTTLNHNIEQRTALLNHIEQFWTK